jgi:putative hemolysin
MIFVYLVLPFLLVIVQGIFTATETAVISIEKSYLGRARVENKKWALRSHSLMLNPDRFFATILVCEDFLLVVSATLFAQYFIRCFGNRSVFFSTLIISFASFFIGQFLPKLLALAAPHRTLMVLSEPIYVISVVTFPVSYFFSQAAKGIAGLVQGKPQADVIRRSDIVYALSEYEKDSSRIVSRLFNMSRRTVAEVMIPFPAVRVARQGRELETLGYKMTRLPVFDEENEKIIGIFNVKDYFFTGKFKLRSPYFVHAADRCLPVFLAMKEKIEHMAIVRDENNVPVGIVTLEDLIEELVGEIRDEK